MQRTRKEVLWERSLQVQQGSKMKSTIQCRELKPQLKLTRTRSRQVWLCTLCFPKSCQPRVKEVRHSTNGYRSLFKPCQSMMMMNRTPLKNLRMMICQDHWKIQGRLTSKLRGSLNWICKTSNKLRLYR